MKNFFTTASLTLLLIFGSKFKITAQSNDELKRDLEKIENSRIEQNPLFDQTRIVGFGQKLYCNFKVGRVALITLKINNWQKSFYPFSSIMFASNCGYQNFELQLLLKNSTITTNYTNSNNLNVNKIITKQTALALTYLVLNFKNRLILKTGVSLSSITFDYYAKATDSFNKLSSEKVTKPSIKTEAEFLLNDFLAFYLQYERYLGNKLILDELAFGFFLYSRF